MKQLTLITNLILSISLCISALDVNGQSYRLASDISALGGEKLNYKVYYSSLLTGNLTAGKTTVEVSDNMYTLNNKKTYKVLIKGWTTGIVELFYTVDDSFESYIDSATGLPVKFMRKAHENNYRREETVYFYQKDQMAINNERKKKKIPVDTHDMVSALYFARAINMDGVRKGDVVSIPFFLDDSVYVTKIIYAGKEKIKISKGEYFCHKFMPMAVKGKVFNSNYPISLWISDDAKRTPILIEAKLSVGRAVVELTD